VAIAGFNSRLTSVTTVEVKGVRPWDEARVEAIVKELEGVPFAHIHGLALQTAILREPSVRAVEFSRMPWGTAKLHVYYRTPVARLFNENVGLDSDGVLFPAPDLPNDIPILRMHNGSAPTLLTQAGNWDAFKIARLAVDVRAVPGSEGVSIQVDDRGVVCLNMTAGRVVLGSCDGLDKKLSVLTDRIRSKPAELSQVAYLNLTKPDVPSVLPKKQVTKTR